MHSLDLKYRVRETVPGWYYRVYKLLFHILPPLPFSVADGLLLLLPV